MANYDLIFPGTVIDDILETGYDLQNAGYIFRGLASGYTGTPSHRSWVIAGEGETGHGLTSAVPAGSIGICMYDGSSWTARIVSVMGLDSTPTTGSGNAVSSGGVASALSSLSAAISQSLESMRFTDSTPAADQGRMLGWTVTMTAGGVMHTITTFGLLAATASKAGLMSAEDKQKVDGFLETLQSMGFEDITPTADAGTKIVETLSMEIGGVETAVTALTILAATASKAGLMSASDKAYLDGIPESLSSIGSSIDSVEYDISRLMAMLGYYVCDTAAGTAAKDVCAAGYRLTTGGCIRIKMTNANSANNVTLNINSTGAKALYYNGQQASSANSWEAGEVLEVYYDGTQYQCASGGGGGKFATGEAVGEVSISEDLTDPDALPTSAAVNNAIAVVAKDSDSTHLVDFCDPDGNLLFYIGTDFTFHAIGNNDSDGDDWEIPCLGLVKDLIEEAIEGIQPSTEGGIEVRDGDNGHVLDVCDENGYLLFYVDADYTFHTVMSSSSFHLPDTVNTYVGDTLQMFYYPTFLDRNFRDIGVNMFVQGEPLRGKSFERYSEYSPSTAGTKTMICTALDKDLGIAAKKTVTVNVVSPSSPSSMKNILLIGDSETEGYVNNSTVSPSADGQTTAMRYPYATEMQRILTSSDAATATAPAGLGLSNIQLIGHLRGDVRHEGYGGRTTAWFMGTASPFYINGSINFNAYLGQDSMYSDTSKKGVDYIYILLGANDGVQTTVMGNRLVLTADTYKSNMIALLNAIKTQIVSGSGAYANPNLKVILLSYVICNPTGGAYHVLGQGQYDNGMKQALSYYKFHEVCDEIAAMDEFSSFVESVYISPQIDSEHAYAYINKQVNSYSEETEKVYVENIHPNTIGYKMYGHAVARDFLSRI